MASARNRRSDAESVIWPQVLLVVAVVALTLIGFVMIYSASQVTILSEAATNYYADTEAGQYLRDTISYSDYIAQQNPSAKLISQFIYSLAGIVIAVAIWFMPAQRLEGRYRQRLLGSMRSAARHHVPLRSRGARRPALDRHRSVFAAALGVRQDRHRAHGRQPYGRPQRRG